MCGIAGYLGNYDPELLALMGSRIAHRGPDGDGVFSDRDAGIGLAHRRLAILDLSEAGHQPMWSHSGRFVISYNGEIYNFPELRRELEQQGVNFRSHCDTEVILELFERLGPQSFERLNGIFALAIWDVRNRQLTLARDGVGVKPLYIASTPSGICFASELKALLEAPDLDRSIDPVAAVSYISYLWTPGRRTMLRDVEKLEPGSWLRVDRSGRRETGTFYRLPLPAPDRSAAEAELIRGTRDALDEAVRRQMLADVDVGAFLSGGLDSSSIVALARQHVGGQKLQCFTIDYKAGSDEAGELVPDLPYARVAAKHLGVDLHEVQVDAGMADDFERLIYQLDEPQADPAALNSLYISELARSNGIKVLLSGAGGDDIFTGYRRHQAARLDRLWRTTPGFVRSLLQSAAASLPVGSTRLRRVRKLLESVGDDPDRALAGYFEWFPVEASAALLAAAPAGAPADVRAPLQAVLDETEGLPAVERVLRIDQHFFLPDHNLNYTDKTGMAAGVEIRVPFLDPDLVDWASRLPLTMKLRGNVTKYAFRKAMEPLLPHDIIYRPKTGFGVPLRAWLKGPMREMLEALTSRQSIEARGLFDAAQVAALKADTLSGRRDGSYALLAVVAVELWMRRFVDGASDVTFVGRRTPQRAAA